MSSKSYKYIIVLIILLGIFLTGCSSNEVNPSEVLESYLSHWMEMDFAKMYEMLSSGSKEYISKEDFISRYENIYNGIQANNLSITSDFVDDELEKEDTSIEIPYFFQIDTLAGKIEFEHKLTMVKELVDEDDEWTIEWNESMIFPEMEEGDTIRVATNYAQRGKIIDSNGIAIAENGEIRSIGIVPGDLGEEAENTKKKLAEAFQMSLEDINKKLDASWVQPHLFVPIGSLSLDEEDKAIDLTSLPGVLAQRVPARVYPLKEATAHLVGYIGNITSEELEKLSDEGYDQNSVLGKAGLEQIFEDRLKARDGKEIRILDKNNLVKHVLAVKEAQDGEDIQLTIDALLQRSIYEEMGDVKGTAVAMNSKTGEVLALVNKPAYNPNLFVLGLSNQQWKDLNEDPDKPLLNRFSQRYTPGSVFKPVVAAIGLEKGLISPEDEISISGLQWQKDASWGNYYINRVSDSGKPVNLRDALVYSDNIYFAQLALNLGEDSFLKGASKFAIGKEIDFEYPIRSSQLVNGGSFTSEILLADSGYGQGEVEVSPLHLTIMYTTFLNQGNMLRPVLLKDDSNKPIIWEENVISQKNADTIKEGLIQVVEDSQGTGHAAKIDGKVLGGKTGTAEFKESQGEKGKNNGWFIAFDDEVIITIMLEDVAGSSVAIPKVRNIIEKYQP